MKPIIVDRIPTNVKLVNPTKPITIKYETIITILFDVFVIGMVVYIVFS